MQTTQKVVVCSSIERLSLAHCSKVTNKGIEAIGLHLHELRALDLSGCKCVNDVTALARGCRALKQLSLREVEHLASDTFNLALIEGVLCVC